ncbi:hypothetical protein CYMTET_35031 [Cymbomonas tetramitiformis]|uniref:Reverse transcriptase/retrotransposon-derived protein RNase H-like domain-containing protein n=1 Tax=Cymbomonas tetramitiformis TaxID=36881 RepID=A0AAE0FA40_9CHLO|nr:hypothetical protein CYMTET_35031 [Cymbomonas tetramitiformis]
MELKAALEVKAPILALPTMKAAADGSAPLLVETDANGVALGGVLMQGCVNGLKAIAYESRQFSAAEQNYQPGERELCEVVYMDLVEVGVPPVDTSNIFEMGPSKSYPAWHAAQEAYLHAVDTLQTIVEQALEATLVFKSRGKYMSSKALDKRLAKVKGVTDKVTNKVSSRAHDDTQTQQKSGNVERTRTEETYTFSSFASEGGPKAPLAGFHLEWMRGGQQDQGRQSAGDAFCAPCSDCSALFAGRSAHSSAGGVRGRFIHIKGTIKEVCTIPRGWPAGEARI